MRGFRRRPPHVQQKSPLFANNLARQRIAATHAFLRSVTAKTPQNCPIRGLSDPVLMDDAAASTIPFLTAARSGPRPQRHKTPLDIIGLRDGASQ